MSPTTVSDSDIPKPATPLSVLHVVLSLDVGGLERIVLDLVRTGGKIGQTTAILCIEKPGALAREVESIGAKLYCADKGPGLHFSTISRIRSILRELRPDVVHTHQISALLYVSLLSREYAPVLVHTVHNNHLIRYHTVRETASYATMLVIGGRRADRFFGVTADAFDSMGYSVLMPRSKQHVVSNGIDLTRFHPNVDGRAVRQSLGISADDLVFGTIGRLDEIKRQDILLDAFAALAGEFPNSHLVLVGDGPMKSTLQQQARSLSVSDRVHFAGYQPKPEEYLAAFDLFVLTSRLEGMPLAVLEAQAMGVPVIASKVGGLEEMRNRGLSILVYDFGDMDGLIGAIRQLASDSGRRRKLGAAGRSHVLADYAIERTARDYHRHYLELMGRATTAARDRTPVDSVQ